jgi:hypothetical protein
MRIAHLASSLGLGVLGVLLGCGGGATGSGGAGGSGTTTSTTSTSAGGAGGGPTMCQPGDCKNPGEACLGGATCEIDCRRPDAVPCAAGTVCDASDASPGKCVAPGGACITTSTPEACGDKICGPGSACTGDGKCYARVPCNSVECDSNGCWGTACACTRAAGCSPAPLGTPGLAGTLQDDTFRKGLVDLEFDPTCGAWGVTLISGPDYLRSIGADGVVASYPGVSNLNMGEVSVLQQIVVPKSGKPSQPAPPPPDPPSATGLDVALTYICCATCGCQLGSTPQGVAHFDAMTSMLPLVVPSKTFTTGIGPWSSTGFDTGPAGLSYGTDRVLYVGNVDVNGDYYRLDLATTTQTLVTSFAARVYASAPFDAVTMLVALEGGEIRLLRLNDGTSTVWTTSDTPVVGMVRDFFDGSVYVSRRDNGIWKYDSAGKGALFQTAANPARISIAPDGWLYGLEIPPPFTDQTPTVARWQLPLMR